MSLSHCLGDATRELGDRPLDQWGKYIDSLPEACPHTNCTPGTGCHACVREYARMQWRIRRELDRRRVAKSGGEHAKG